MHPYSSCYVEKLSRVYLVSKEHTSHSSFDIVFYDVWVKRLYNIIWIIVIDDVTHFTWVYFMKIKSEVFYIFFRFEKLIKTQFDKSILALHSDWAVNINV